MIKQLATATLFVAATLGAYAQVAAPRRGLITEKDNAKVQSRPTPVQVRAARLSDQMARELRLNGYQSTRLRAINEDKIAKMVAIEQRNAGNPKLIDEQCGLVCKERDRELQAVLSNDQYSNYYGSRSAYYRYDKDYASRTSNVNSDFVNSVQNPSPASSGATIAPARKPASTTR